jgi:hypothetical protein
MLPVLRKTVFFHILVSKCNDAVSKNLECTKCEFGRAVFQSTFSLNKLTDNSVHASPASSFKTPSPSHSACQRGRRTSRQYLVFLYHYGIYFPAFCIVVMFI